MHWIILMIVVYLLFATLVFSVKKRHNIVSALDERKLYSITESKDGFIYMANHRCVHVLSKSENGELTLVDSFWPGGGSNRHLNYDYKTLKDNYRQFPVLLWEHNHNKPPIGKVIFKEGFVF